MSSMKFRYFRAPALALVAGLVMAPFAYAVASTPSQPVSVLDNALISLMKSASAQESFQARYQTLAPVIEQSYNLPLVTQNSVGFLWSTLPAAQQKELIDLFTKFTISSYVSQFDGFSGQKLALLPDEKALGEKKIVLTQLTSPDGTSVQIDYVMGKEGDDWKINDVLLNGTISQVAVHASDFASLVKSGDASKLILALQAKIKTLQGS